MKKYYRQKLFKIDLFYKKNCTPFNKIFTKQAMFN